MVLITILSIASTSFVQGKPQSDAVVWKTIASPVDIALTSVGTTRSKLVSRLESETRDRNFALPKSATPSQWIYEWSGQGQSESGQVRRQVQFSKAGTVDKVTISAISRSGLPQLGLLSHAWPKLLSKPSTDRFKSTVTLNQKNASLWVNMARLKSVYTANSYKEVNSGSPNGRVELVLTSSQLVKGSQLQLLCWDFVSTVSTPKRVLNTGKGVYENSISIKNFNVEQLKVISIAASKLPSTPKSGYTKVGFSEANWSVGGLERIPATDRDEALVAARQVVTAIEIFCDENSGRLPTTLNFKRSLDPFVKNSTVLRNFTWTYTGSTLKEITSPDSTELGFVRSASGRAVIYASMAVRYRQN